MFGQLLREEPGSILCFFLEMHSSAFIIHFRFPKDAGSTLLAILPHFGLGFIVIFTLYMITDERMTSWSNSTSCVVCSGD